MKLKSLCRVRFITFGLYKSTSKQPQMQHIVNNNFMVYKIIIPMLQIHSLKER